jgi:hypothetical protein
MRSVIRFLPLTALCAVTILCSSCSLYSLSGGVYHYNISGSFPFKEDDAIHRAWTAIMRYVGEKLASSSFHVLKGGGLIIVERDLAFKKTNFFAPTEKVTQCQQLEVTVTGLPNWESEVDIRFQTYDGPCLQSLTIEPSTIVFGAKPDQAFDDMYREIVKSLSGI